jgi:hypothetical protein
MSTAAASRVLVVGSLVWIGLAIALGATGAFAALRPPAPQLVILAVTIGAVVATRVGAVRSWVDSLSLRALVGIHGIRFVGATFLVVAARGALSPIFAARAGWGDIAAAALALILVASGPPVTAARRWAYLAWNAFGMLDLIVAVGTATMVVLRGDVPGMDPILRVPLILVPMFFVPLLFASHVVIFRRLLAAGAQQQYA